MKIVHEETTEEAIDPEELMIEVEELKLALQRIQELDSLQFALATLPPSVGEAARAAALEVIHRLTKN